MRELHAARKVNGINMNSLLLAILRESLNLDIVLYRNVFDVFLPQLLMSLSILPKPSKQWL